MRRSPRSRVEIGGCADARHVQSVSIAVISDIHGNLCALEAVLDEIDADRRIRSVWCLGDMVGRGPRPEQCARLVRERCSLVLAGNHDRVVCGLEPLFLLGDESGVARWTNAVMSDDTLHWMRSLPSALVRPGVTLCHGGPADPVWQFISDRTLALTALASVRSRLLLVGHTHRADMFRLRDGVIKNSRFRAPASADLDSCRAVLNPGALGLATNGNPDASWLLLADDGRSCRWMRTHYDVEATADQMRAEDLAERHIRSLGRLTGR